MTVDLDVIKVAVAAAVGWLAALITFRTRLALMDRRIESVEATLRRFTPVVNGLDKRTLYMLQLLADVAKANGVDRRVPDDLLVQLLTEKEAE